MFVVIGGLLCVGAAGVWLAIAGCRRSRDRAPRRAAARRRSPRHDRHCARLRVSRVRRLERRRHAVRRNARPRARHEARLIVGMSIVTALYLLVNWAFLRGLGRAGFVASSAPGADLMRYVFGTPGEVAIVAVVAITSITSMNAILIAGARTTYAAARDTEALTGSAVGTSRAARRTPRSSRSLWWRSRSSRSAPTREAVSRPWSTISRRSTGCF